MAERPVRKASLWRKAANAAMVAGLAGCQLAERIGYITPPPEGTKTNPAETTLPPTEKEIEATSTETSTPAIIATEVRPAAKGTDELSIKIQNYLNSYYSELGISEAEEKSQPVSVEGGGLFVFAESRYGKEDKRLPLLIEIGMDLSLKNVWLLERNGNYSGGDVLVKYEYLAYSFEEGGKNVLLLQGPAVLRLKTGEFKIFFDNNWRTAQSPSERHIEPLKELLTGEDYARPSGDYIVITPKPQPTEVIEANPPLVQPESL
ncbi:MAG: hypothetical protein Q8P91_01690, partial [bacterium]|nr:hypothetical protein [bacterium]